MIQRIYALRDKKANYFNTLNLYENDLIAVREFHLMIEQRNLKKQDYDIICLGAIDTTHLTPEIILKPELKYQVSLEKIAEKIDNNIKEFSKYAKGL